MMHLHGQKYFQRAFSEGLHRVWCGILADRSDLVRILPEGNMKAYADRFHLVAAEKKRDDFPGWLEGIRRRVEEETGRTSPEDRAAESDCRHLQQGGKLGKWLWHICRKK